MAEATLITHCGATQVGRGELARIETPPATETWFPVGHVAVLDKVGEALQAAGYKVARERLALSRGGNRFFGTLDLEQTLVSGVTLAVGIRNSIDKSLPFGFCAGNRVFVCDNLAFHSDLSVTRKHTRYGDVRFQNAIAEAVASLTTFQAEETERIHRMQAAAITEERAAYLLVQAVQKDIVAAPVLPRIWKELMRPSHNHATSGLTLWDVMQSFTEVLGPRAKRNPFNYAGLTMKLNGLLVPNATQMAS